MESLRYGLCLFLLLGLMALPASGLASSNTRPQDLAGACEDLSKKIKGEAIREKTLAVRPFLSAERQNTLLGVRLQDQLTMALASRKGRNFRVVERLRLADLDTERLLYGEGKGDDLEAWARRLEAHGVILGTYILDKDTVTLECRVVAPKTGECLLAAQSEVRLTPLIRRLAATPAPTTPMIAAMESLAPGPGSQEDRGRSSLSLFRIQQGRSIPFPPGEPITLHVGETIGFSIRPPMDSRLYVLNYDPQSRVEEMIFLYPLPKISPVIFQKERTYAFPGCIDPKAVSYPVDGPLGRMVFKVLGVEAGEASVDLVKGLPSASGYYALHLKDLKDVIQRLRVLPGAAWWEESVEFWVSEK